MNLSHVFEEGFSQRELGLPSSSSGSLLQDISYQIYAQRRPQWSRKEERNFYPENERWMVDDFRLIWVLVRLQGC